MFMLKYLESLLYRSTLTLSFYCLTGECWVQQDNDTENNVNSKSPSQLLPIGEDCVDTNFDSLFKEAEQTKKVRDVLGDLLSGSTAASKKRKNLNVCQSFSGKPHAAFLYKVSKMKSRKYNVS